MYQYLRVNQKPVEGELATYQVQHVPPFASCGIDYAGPITIKQYKVKKTSTI